MSVSFFVRKKVSLGDSGGGLAVVCNRLLLLWACSGEKLGNKNGFFDVRRKEFFRRFISLKRFLILFMRQFLVEIKFRKRKKTFSKSQKRLQKKEEEQGIF